MNEPNYARPPKVAFTVFGLDIRFYAIMILIGVLLAIVVVSFLFKRRNIPVGWVIDLLLCVLPLGIIGARTFSVLTERGSSIADWFNFQGGGLSITGGIIGGALGVVLFCLIHKINFLRVADCLVPGLILAQAIGRWGNFFNQEVYGGKVTDPALQWFPFAVYIDDVGEWHYAFFFYEMLANLLIFALLFTLMWKCNKRPSGLSMAGYFFGYGLVRSIMEPLRDPQFQLGHTVMISEVFAILMCVGGFLLAAVLIGWNKYKHGSFFGSKNSEPLAVLPVYYTKEQRKAMEEEKKKTAARILRAAGESALPEEEAPAPPPEEKKPLAERFRLWREELPGRIKEFFRPYSPAEGGEEAGEGGKAPAEKAEQESVAAPAAEKAKQESAAAPAAEKAEQESAAGEEADKDGGEA